MEKFNPPTFPASLGSLCPVDRELLHVWHGPKGTWIQEGQVHSTRSTHSKKKVELEKVKVKDFLFVLAILLLVFLPDIDL